MRKEEKRKTRGGAERHEGGSGALKASVEQKKGLRMSEWGKVVGFK